MTEPVSRVSVVRVREGLRSQSSDETAAEVPLEVRVQGSPFAVIMRTPGSDRSLAAGFLLSERIIRDADDIDLIEHCTDTTLPAGSPAENVINITLAPGAAARAAATLSSRRQVMAGSACGVCGRATLDALRTDLEPMTSRVEWRPSIVAALPARLRHEQPVFSVTGGLHAAGVFDSDGRRLAVAEDIGRHNAVDKVIGALLLRGQLPAPSAALCVSGRASFEIVQKAWCAGIPVVASVSAPSSLAVSVAGEAGMTLVGFVRDGGFNIYSGEARISARES